jgi:hypothetical protein
MRESRRGAPNVIQLTSGDQAAPIGAMGICRRLATTPVVRRRTELRPRRVCDGENAGDADGAAERGATLGGAAFASLVRQRGRGLWAAFGAFA